MSASNIKLAGRIERDINGRSAIEVVTNGGMVREREIDVWR